jgi:prepilin-type N-terminal cleavage/methylation domain-containing protein
MDRIRQSGITLLELMITMFIVGIVLGSAYPI